MKIAFVYDRINKFGGAERTLLALREIWPEAPLFTAVYNSKRASWAKGFKVNPSFLQNIPFASVKHEVLPTFTPYAFESFQFGNYDVVLTITSADAKGIITLPKTLHVCYCLTPTRYLWSGFQDYLCEPGSGRFNFLIRTLLKFVSPKLRQWDFIAAQRPDRFFAISQTVSKRIRKYYKREARIIFPPVDTDTFQIAEKSRAKDRQEYFLIVSRLVPYKKIDYVISVFNKIGKKLIIIGSGLDEKRLKKKALKNTEFIPANLTDQKLCWYYQNCKALIFPGEEDFGLTSIEVQACGRPVIAFSQGGVKEGLLPGKTGELFDSQSEDSLISVLDKFEKNRYLSSDCRNNAIRFSKDTFKKIMKMKLEKLWETHKKSI